ncbi:MAG: AraC-like DNA-binding protein [Crocinitomix sp.]
MSFSRKDFKLSDKVVLGRAIFKGPFKASAALEEEARFVHVVSGKSKLFVPNDQLDINPTDSFLIKCESFVNSWAANNNGTVTEVIIFKFYPEILKEIYQGKMPEYFNSKTNVPHQPAEKIGYHDLIKQFYEGLNYYFDHPEMMTDDFLKLKIKELIHILVHTDKTGKVKLILGNLFKTNAYEFKDIINANLYQNLKLDDLAFFAGLSLSTFKRKFNTVFGESPKKYINDKKLERSKFLLETTELRVSEIAYDCGYNDVAYFSKAFNAKFNLAPSVFKKSLEKDSN